MRLVVPFVFAATLAAQPAAPFSHLATTRDGSVVYFSSPAPLLDTGAVTTPKIFLFDGQTLRLVAQQDATTLGWTSVSDDGRMLAYSGQSAGGFEASLARGDGSVFWTTLGQAAISGNGAYALFLPGDGTLLSVDLTGGSAFTVPVEGLLSLAGGARAVAADGTIAVRAPREIALVQNGSVQTYAAAGDPQSVAIDDAASTVAYEAAGQVFVFDVAGGQPLVNFPGTRPHLTADGRRVLYLAPDESGAPQAWVAPRDGSGARQLTSEASGLSEAVISGNGAIAYAATADGARLLRIDVSAGAARDLTAEILAAGDPRPRVISFAVAPAAIGPGGAAQLCYRVANVDAVSISPGFGSVPVPAGCLAVNPAATTAYTLTGTAAAGQVTATATLTVAGNVQIANFSNDPPYSTSGSPVTLRWSTQNAASVVITGLGVPRGALPVNGSIVVNPTTNTSYTLIAYGLNGQAVSAVLYVFVR